MRDVTADNQKCIRLFHQGFERGALFFFGSLLATAFMTTGQAATVFFLVSGGGALYAAPRSVEEAGQLTNWFESLGIVLAPFILLSGVAVVLGSSVYQSGRASMEYAHSRVVSPMLDAGKATLLVGQGMLTSAKRRCLQYYTTRRPALTMDDFTFLGEVSPVRSVRHRPGDRRRPSPASAAAAPAPGAAVDVADDWVFLDS